MNKFNRRYSRISSLEQLREERNRLDSLLDIKELELKHDYTALKQMFTLSYVLEAVTSRFSSAGPVINGVIDGFYLVKSLVGGLKKKRRC